MKTSRLGSRISIYVVITSLLSAIFYALIIASGQSKGAGGAFSVGLMWCPGVAALLSCRITGQDLRSIGWAWPGTRWTALAYFTPLAYAFVAYTAVWMTGIGAAPSPAYIDKIKSLTGWTGVSDGVLVAGWIALLATTGMVRGLAGALGEEIGWRGYLAPLANERFGFVGGAMLTGAIWAAWHMPILLFADYNNGVSKSYALACFFILVVATSIPMAWIRLRSGSVWPAAIFHASHNLFVQAVFTPITVSTSWISPYAIDEFGFALPIVVMGAAWLFWRRDRALVQPCGDQVRFQS